MFKWFKKRKLKADPATKMVDVNKLNLPTNPILTGAATIQYPTNIMNGAYKPPLMGMGIQSGAVAIGGINSGNIVTSGPSSKFFAAASGQGQFTIQAQQPTNLLTITGYQNQEIVRLNANGEVVWPNGYQVDEAAEVFAKSLYLSVECAAGIRTNTKEKIRDAVFTEMIDMANAKGNLTADDLTYLWQSAKIMDKLKGIN